MAKLTLEYWQDDGWFVGRLREVPGVLSQGKTLKSLEANIRDAYKAILRDRPKVKRPTKSKTTPIAA